MLAAITFSNVLPAAATNHLAGNPRFAPIEPRWRSFQTGMPGHSKCTPGSVKEPVLGRPSAGAPGVILSRKSSEMGLAERSGAGEAICE